MEKGEDEKRLQKGGMESKGLGSLLLPQPQGGGFRQATPKHLRKHELSANFWKIIQLLFRVPRHYKVKHFEDALLNHHAIQAELGFSYNFQR